MIDIYTKTKVLIKQCVIIIKSMYYNTNKHTI